MPHAHIVGKILFIELYSRIQPFPSCTPFAIELIDILVLHASRYEFYLSVKNGI